MDVLRTLGTRVTAPALMLMTCREADKDQGGDHLPTVAQRFHYQDPNRPQCTMFWGHDLPKLPPETAPPRVVPILIPRTCEYVST